MIRTPNDDDRDRVRWDELIAIALAGLSLGLGLVVGVAQSSNPTETTASAASAAQPNAAAASQLHPPSASVAATAADKAEEPAPAVHLHARAARPPEPDEPVEVAANTQPIERALAEASVVSVPAVERAAPAPPQVPPVTSEPITSEPAPSSEPERDDGTEKTVAKAAPPEPAQANVAVNAQPRAANAKPNKRAPARHFKFGLVVYARCDGLQRNNKPATCPRDRQLELQVWQALATLEQCRNDPGVGEAELRLTLHRRGAPAVDLGAVKGARSLNLRAVSQCAGPGLAKVRSHLRSPHAVVTFRFNMS